VKPPRSVLVIVTRRIGDVLLATPLLASLKAAWPDAAVDALVFEGTQHVISASPGVRRVHTIAQRPAPLAHLAFMLRLARRYDVALSLVPGDRPTFYAYLAGRWRAGLLLPTRKERWKRRFLDRWIAFDERDTHTVLMHLALAQALEIPAQREVSVTWDAGEARQVDAVLGAGGPPLAVLHPFPRFAYKMWPGPRGKAGSKPRVVWSNAASACAPPADRESGGARLPVRAPLSRAMPATSATNHAAGQAHA
jgi:heptosyltransferase-3